MLQQERRKGRRSDMETKWKKRNRHRGSIFRKLMGSYIVFVLIAIVITVSVMIVYLLSSVEGSVSSDFPGLTILEDGSIGNLDDVETLGGWVEELNDDFTVLKVYGEKKTKDMHYTEKQLLDGADQKEGLSDYYLYWQTKDGGYYLIHYPKGAFSVNYSFDVGWVFENNLDKGATFILVTLLLMDLLGVSFYISRKIRRPLNNLISGMKRVEQGEEQVELSMQTEKEFVEIQEAFNHMTEQLYAQKAENEKMSKSRQRMLLELSHDIKTPVATIKSYAYALQNGLVPEAELTKYYQTIALKADRVNTMSEDLFTMLKMESADYQLELKTLDIAELTRQICAEFYEEITEAGFDFEIEIPEEAVLINGDKKLLTRVISNLLTNAKKYNQTGKQIKIVLENKKQKMVLDASEGKEISGISDEERDIVIVRIIDDGTLIEPSVKETMFYAFVRGESARSTKGGTGLGLAIAKAVMEKHSGSISYEERDGMNVFELMLPKQSQ